MNTKQAFQSAMSLTSTVLNSYISDLTDEELLTRPGEGCNHLAWQLGHLITSEGFLLNLIQPGTDLELPEGFAEKHSKDATGVDDPAQFCTKQEYLELFDKVHAVSLAVLEQTSDEDLDKPAPDSFASICPTMGDLFMLLATHGMMHAGQFVPVRRKLGKPVLI